MSVWNETVAAAKDVLEIAAQKTEKAVEVQKKNFAVHRQKNKISKKFEALGRCYFDGTKGDESSKQLLDGLCEELEGELATLKTLKKELYQLKNQD